MSVTLTLVESKILRAVERCPQTTRDDVIARHASPSNLRRILRKLEREGLVRSVSAPGANDKLWMRSGEPHA